MLELKITKFYTCDEANVAFQLSFNCTTADAAAKALFDVVGMAIPELPPLGGDTPWREMTNEEATAYMAEQAEEEKQERIRVAMDRAERDDDYEEDGRNG